MSAPTHRWRAGRLALRVALLLPVAAGSTGGVAAEDPTAEPFPDAPAVVLASEMSWTVAEHDGVLELTRRILVRRAEGVSEANQFFDYVAPRARLLGLSARTVLPGGAFRELTPDLWHDTVLYGDGEREYHRVQLTFPGVVEGATLEYSYRLQQDDPWPWPWWDIQLDQPVLASRLRVLMRESRSDFRVTLYGRVDWSRWCHSTEPRQERKGVVYEFSCANVPAYVDEPDGPPEPRARLRRLAAFEPATSRPFAEHFWGYISRTWHERITRFREVSAAADAQAQRLALANPGVPPAERVLRWLHDHLAIELEEGTYGQLDGSHRHTVDGVLRAGGGLPNELTVTALVMLKASGLAAWPVLAADRNWDSIDLEQPNLYLDGRLLIEVREGNASRFLDPLCSTCPGGAADWRFAGPAIRIDGATVATPVTIPAMPAQDNRRVLRYRVDARDPEDLPGVEIDAAWTGHEADAIRSIWREMDPRARVRRLASVLLPRGGLSDVDIPKERAVSTDVTVQARGASAGLVEPVEGWLVLCPPAPFGIDDWLRADGERETALELDYARRTEVEVRFLLPAGRRVGRLPSASLLEGPGLVFRARWDQDSEEEVSWFATLEIGRAEIPASDWPAAQLFAQRVANALRGGLAIPPGPADAERP